MKLARLILLASLSVCGLPQLGLVALAFGEIVSPVNSIATYEVRGVLKAYNPSAHQATISHEEVPGYMQAMTMSFEIHDLAEFRDLRPGDELTFRLCVTADQAWIERVRKTDAKPVSLLQPTPVKPGRELEVGDFFPDAELVDQLGKKIRLSDFHGHALALTFIYTRCPLPTYCPLINRNFQLAQSLLARLAPEENGRFLSLSLDSPHDTPEVLADYAKNYQADSHQWIFATGDDRAVRALGESVGLEFSRDVDGRIDHNLRTVVLDASGCLRAIFRGNTWTPQELASAMRAAMKRKPSGRE